MNPVVTVTNATASATQMPYFIGWGTLSLINAGLAQSKGHSGFFWWFVSLFLGPVATFLIVVFLEAPKPMLPNGAPPQPQGKPAADTAAFNDLA